MKYYVAILFLFFISSVYSQEKEGKLVGSITFITSEHTYVRFASTESMQIGDTLFNGNNTACLQIENKSSSSCICKNINNCEPVKGDQVYYSPIAITVVESNEVEEQKPLKKTIKKTEDEPSELKQNDVPTPPSRERIFGRLSASSYSSFLPEDNDDNHRLMSRFSFNYEKIKNSNFSFESYVNYRQNISQRATSSNRPDKIFRIYNAAIRYEIDSVVTAIIGRKINPKMASIGAVDGLQIEKNFGTNSWGAIVGFRPDLYDYGFNPNLLEYGTYFSKSMASKNVQGQFTIGVLEQRNSGHIDRRYGYLQNYTRINRNINLFTSIEVDFYSKVLEKINASPRMTNLFISARYRMNKMFSFSASYDARNRIVFYETFKTNVERLLDDEIRQGVRLRMNVRPLKYITTGLSYSIRFQSNDQNNSENLNGFVSISNIPLIGGRVYFNCNFNKSNFQNNEIYSYRYARNLIKKWLEGDFYFRKVKYIYTNQEYQSTQHYIGTSLSFRLMKTLSLNTLGEVSIRNKVNTYRVNTKIIKRFGSKRKR